MKLSGYDILETGGLIVASVGFGMLVTCSCIDHGFDVMTKAYFNITFAIMLVGSTTSGYARRWKKGKMPPDK